MSCGPPTKKVSSCSPTGATAIPRPSRSMPAAISSHARHTKEAFAFSVCEDAFKEFGLPAPIRKHNGSLSPVPTRSSTCRSSRSGAEAGHRDRAHQARYPQQNGRPQRMHLTLKLETTKPAGANFLPQQARTTNLSMSTTASARIRPSARPDDGLPELDYPFKARSSPSPLAPASAINAKRSTSVRSSLARPSR